MATKFGQKWAKIYTAELEQIVTRHGLRLYADDCQVYISTGGLKIQDLKMKDLLGMRRAFVIRYCEHLWRAYTVIRFWRSCIFMHWHLVLVLYFQVLYFLVLHFQRPRQHVRVPLAVAACVVDRGEDAAAVVPESAVGQGWLPRRPGARASPSRTPLATSVLSSTVSSLAAHFTAVCPSRYSSPFAVHECYHDARPGVYFASSGLLQLTVVRHQRRTTSSPPVGAERCRPLDNLWNLIYFATEALNAFIEFISAIQITYLYIYLSGINN